MSKQKRKIFYLSDDKPIMSGGLLLYRFIKNEMELLLVEGRGFYEDLGGRVDDDDKDIFSTVSREAFEESNELLNKRSIKSRIKNAPYVYVPKYKYIVYILKANENEASLKSKDFGTKEIHDDIHRTIKWINLDTFLMPEIIKHKLNFRLKSSQLFNKLKEIRNDKKLDYNMFTDSSNTE